MGGIVLYLKRFLKAKDTYTQNAIVQKYMRDKLLEILRAQHRVDFKYIFEFGAGNGELSALLCKMLTFTSYVCNDINDYKVHFDDTRMRYECFDMKELLKQKICQMQFELIVSNATLQWLDFEQTLCDIKQILSPNGYCLLSTFGEQNCYEVKAITDYGLSYISLECMREILTKHFTIILLEEEIMNLDFPTSLDVFRHLRLSGVNALSQNGFIGKNMLCEYERRFKNRLTYHPIYMLLRHKENL